MLSFPTVRAALVAFLSLTFAVRCAPTDASLREDTLYLRAIGVEQGTGFARPECWAIEPPMSDSTAPGLSGSLTVNLVHGNTTAYTYFPEALTAPLHGPPANQFSVTLAGSTTSTFPNVSGSFKAPAGTVVAVIDNSSVSTGHYTFFEAGTIILFVRFKDGIPPNHTRVSTALCGY